MRNLAIFERRYATYVMGSFRYDAGVINEYSYLIDYTDKELKEYSKKLEEKEPYGNNRAISAWTLAEEYDFKNYNDVNKFLEECANPNASSIYFKLRKTFIQTILDYKK